MSTSSRFAVAVHALTLMAWSDDEPLKSEQIAVSVKHESRGHQEDVVQLAEDKLVFRTRVRRAVPVSLAKPHKSACSMCTGLLSARYFLTSSETSQPPLSRGGKVLGGIWKNVRGEIDSAMKMCWGITMRRRAAFEAVYQATSSRGIHVEVM